MLTINNKMLTFKDFSSILDTFDFEEISPKIINNDPIIPTIDNMWIIGFITYFDIITLRHSVPFAADILIDWNLKFLNDNLFIASSNDDNDIFFLSSLSQ